MREGPLVEDARGPRPACTRTGPARERQRASTPDLPYVMLWSTHDQRGHVLQRPQEGRRREDQLSIVLVRTCTTLSVDAAVHDMRHAHPPAEVDIGILKLGGEARWHGHWGRCMSRQA